MVSLQFKHFYGLHLKPGLIIEITYLNTVRIRIAIFYTFKQTVKLNCFSIWGPWNFIM